MPWTAEASNVSKYEIAEEIWNSISIQ